MLYITKNSEYVKKDSKGDIIMKSVRKLFVIQNVWGGEYNVMKVDIGGKFGEKEDTILEALRYATNADYELVKWYPDEEHGACICHEEDGNTIPYDSETFWMKDAIKSIADADVVAYHNSWKNCEYCKLLYDIARALEKEVWVFGDDGSVTLYSSERFMGTATHVFEEI